MELAVFAHRASRHHDTPLGEKSREFAVPIGAFRRFAPENLDECGVDRLGGRSLLARSRAPGRGGEEEFEGMEALGGEDVFALNEPRKCRFVDAELGRKRPLSERDERGRTVVKEPLLVAEEPFAERKERASSQREAVQEAACLVAAPSPVGRADSGPCVGEATDPQARKPVVAEPHPQAFFRGFDHEVGKETHGGKPPETGSGGGIEEAKKTAGTGDLFHRAGESSRQGLVAGVGEIRQREGKEREEERPRRGRDVVATLRLGAQAVPEVERKAADGIESLEAVTDGLEFFRLRRWCAGVACPQFLERLAEVAPLVDPIEEMLGKRPIARVHAKTRDLFGQMEVKRRRRGGRLRRRSGIVRLRRPRGLVGEEERVRLRVVFRRRVLRSLTGRGWTLTFGLKEGIFTHRGRDRLTQLVAVEDKKAKTLAKTRRQAQAGAGNETRAEAGHARGS